MLYHDILNTVLQSHDKSRIQEHLGFQFMKKTHK